MKDVRGGLADQLANLIEKYAGTLALDTLPDPVRTEATLEKGEENQKISPKDIVIEKAA